MVSQAKANSFDNFALAAGKKVQDLMIDGIASHQGLVSKYLDDPGVKRDIDRYIAERIYKEIREPK